ncbi:MAG: tetratricopeptide repeat protein [Verrucomicrobiae bacterium]|nr:tetratricopeptide repeat protein [Verrucomicrobiae bacterium]
MTVLARMSRIAVLFLALSSFLSAFARAASDPDVTFMGGNRAYEDGRFADAEQVYRSLTEEGYVSIELFLNLGNALYRTDRPGEAALWYRRALELDPRSAEARQNLQVVKNLTGYHEFELDGADAWLARLSPGEIVAVLSTGCWIALLALVAAFLLPRLRDWRPLLFVVAGLSLATAGLSTWGLIRQQKQVDTDDLAIVIANESAALAGNFPDAEKVVDLPPGSELQILQRRGAWTYVAIPPDLRGWVKSDAIGAVRWYGPHAAPSLDPELAKRSP